MAAASWLANQRETRAVLERHGLSLKHKLGQNFLIDDTVIKRILSLAELEENDIVLEVGPGIGTLTVAMLPEVSRVVAIEADRDLPKVLAETCAQDSEKLFLISGDALKVNPQEIESVVGTFPNKFVSNLPYQVAATIILEVLENMPEIERLVVMVQAEVADRIAAKPKSKAYGAYTAKLSLLAEVTGRFEVSPASFMPPPHVDSAVIRLDRKPLIDASEIEWVFKVIEGAFCQRRKTIRNTLSSSGFDKAVLDAAFDKVGIDGRLRAEVLSPADFIRLADALKEEQCE